jgi:concentrative nucleoside transporter, CNT family
MERLIALGGLVAIVLAAVCLSNNRKAINWRTVSVGIGIQFALALLILKVPYTSDAFRLLGKGVENVLGYALDGAVFAFDDKLARGAFAIRIGVSIIFIASLSALFYYLGIMQRLVKLTAGGLNKALGITGPEAVSTAAAVFVGQVECQVLIKPYLSKLTSSELFTSLTAAMATISGSALVAYTAMGMNPTHLIAASIMSAVGGIVTAKIFYPEVEPLSVTSKVELAQMHDGVNALDAIALGAKEGGIIAANVVTLVIVGVAYMSMFNGIVGVPLQWFGLTWTIQDILGVFFTPVAFVTGVPWHEAFHIGRLISTKIMINEYAAYGELSKVIAGTGAYALSEKSQMIATMALCGFCNLTSMAINIVGLGAMAPERRPEVAKMVFRALIAANFASWMTAAIAGMLL